MTRGNGNGHGRPNGAGGVSSRTDAATGPMTPERWDLIEDLLLAALEVPDAERGGFLARACAGDDALRAEVESLLAAHAAPGPADRLADTLGARLLTELMEGGSLEGETVGRYEVGARLGRGGMSVVYRAWDPKLERHVALKFLPGLVNSDAASRQRLLVEAQTAAGLEHPNICTIHEIGEAGDGRLFMAMPLYDGQTLRAKLESGPLGEEEATRLALDVARGLARAHARGVIHRDIKPGNLMITRDGTLKILDFGIARLEGTTHPMGRMPGTAYYMSPEQVAGRPVDGRADLWSLGVVLYEMLAGRRPFEGDTREAVRRAVVHQEAAPLTILLPGISRDLAALIHALLQKDPDRRPGSADEVAEALGRAEPTGQLEDARVPGPPGRRRPSTRVPVLVATALALLIGGVWLVAGRTGAAEPRVVVAPFENRTGDTTFDPLGYMAADWITRGLMSAAIADVVPTTVALGSAREIERRARTGADIDPLLALAREAGATIVVSGAYYRHSDSLRFEVRITEAGSARLLVAPDPITWPDSVPMEAIDLLRGRTVGSVASLLDERKGVPARASQPPPSYAAYREFSEGMQAFIDLRYREAVVHFQRATTLSPDYLVPRLLSAVAHINMNALPVADTLLASLEHRRDELGAYDRALLDLFRAGLGTDLREQYRAAKRVVELAPNTLPHVQWGKAALRLGRPREALQIFDQLDPARGGVQDWPVYWNGLTESHHMLGEHRRELDVARRARALHPADPVYHLLEARALAALGRTDEIDAVIDSRLRLDLDRPRAPGRLMNDVAAELAAHGYTAASRRLYQRSVAWHEALPESERARWKWRFTYGPALMGVGRRDEATALFRTLADELPDNIYSRAMLAILAAERGETPEAARMDAWLEAHKEPYWDTETTVWRAAAAAHLGRPEEAVRLLRQALATGTGYGIALHASFMLDPLRDYPPFQALLRPTG